MSASLERLASDGVGELRQAVAVLQSQLSELHAGAAQASRVALEQQQRLQHDQQQREASERRLASSHALRRPAT